MAHYVGDSCPGGHLGESVLPPASRASDPETSRLAEQSVTPEPRMSMVRLVVEHVRAWCDVMSTGMTREDCARMMGTDNWDKVGKRLSDAEKLGFIRKQGTRRASNGRLQSCYFPVEQEEQGRLV